MENIIDFAGKAPSPWNTKTIIPGAGIIASGWT